MARPIEKPSEMDSLHLICYAGWGGVSLGGQLFIKSIQALPERLLSLRIAITTVENQARATQTSLALAPVQLLLLVADCRD